MCPSSRLKDFSIIVYRINSRNWDKVCTKLRLHVFFNKKGEALSLSIISEDYNFPLHSDIEREMK